MLTDQNRREIECIKPNVQFPSSSNIFVDDKPEVLKCSNDEDLGFNGILCVKFICGTFSMTTSDNSATISITGNLIQETKTSMNLTSEARIIVPANIKQLLEPFNQLPDEASFTTKILPDVTTSGFTLTVIIISAVVALLILLIIICILVKWDFFKRTTIEEQEQEDSQKPLTEEKEDEMDWKSA